VNEWLRKKILSLIGGDIESIAIRSYNDGCYTTERRMQVEHQIQIQALVRHNEALQKAASDCLALTMPERIIVTSAEHLAEIQTRSTAD